MPKYQGHEKVDASAGVNMGGEKAFGVTFAVVFVLVASWPLINSGQPILWAYALAAFFAVCAFALPKILKPLNFAWFKFGMLLHKVMNPIIMGIMFYGLITPMGLLMRIMGRKPLALSFDKSVDSYWIKREDEIPANEAMKNQF